MRIPKLVSASIRFRKTSGVNPNVLHQPRFGSDHCWISAGNAMQDLDKAPLQLLLIGSSPDNTYTLLIQPKPRCLVYPRPGTS